MLLSILGASLLSFKTMLIPLILLHLVQCGVSQSNEYSVAEFLQDANHSLKIESLSRIRVKTAMQCLIKCRRNSNCVSYNIGTKKDHTGTRWCELLPKDKHKILYKLEKNDNYHHYSKPELCVNAVEYPKVKEDYSYVCKCKPGYTGIKCEIDINECESSPCQNNGICKDMINYYKCQCSPGFAGTNCQTNINECASEPCKNGSCIDMIARYRCDCFTGFTGVNCETVIDPCTPNPCTNGGTCSDINGAMSCSCVSGFTGDKCENSTCPANVQYSEATGLCIYKPSSSGSGGWTGARDACTGLSLNLPSIHSQEMNEKIRNEASSYMWIGLKYKNGKYVWSDGSALDYTNWAGQQQSGNCVYMQEDGLWYKNPCNYSHSYICVKVPIV